MNDLLQHNKRVGELCYRLSEDLGFPSDFNNKAKIGGMLHDLGKIRISEQILDKEGSLTNEEMLKVKQHPIYSHELALMLGVTDPIILNGLLEHHENEDGSGYPLGLKGNQISDLGRIIHICDVFDALRNKRSYKQAMSVSRVLETMDTLLTLDKIYSDYYTEFKVMILYDMHHKKEIIR